MASLDLNLTDQEFELLAPFLEHYDWANPEDGLYFVFNPDSKLIVRLWTLNFEQGRDFWLT